MNQKTFREALKYINTKSVVINIAPATYIRTEKDNIISDPDYIITKDEYSNTCIIPYDKIIMIHEF